MVCGRAHDEVAVEDAGVDHRVAPDPQHEQVAVAGEVGREREELLDVLLGQHVGAGGDVADERDVADGPALDGGAGGRVEADLDGPGLGGVAHAGSRSCCSVARWACTVEGEVRPTASPISRTDGG